MQTIRKWTKHLVIASALFLAASAAAQAADDMGNMPMSPKKSEPAAKPADAKAPTAKAGQRLEIAITDKGFEPNKVEVKKGQPVEFVFTRKTDQTCIKEVVLDTGPKKIQKPLPLTKPVTIKAKFAKAGELTYACNMNMFSGTVTVQ